ncbi:hypothetical protein AA0473_0643 [Acetobacter orleanensis NRIC 0473]|uniref:Uncharacterized protein n=1 Tax=Acetobacter orleanensis TaxID=104099 RepID=A0A4Y3TMN4_9PROT|nr:hypothetical protein Abol_021_094 [Acetobacter orleanensis JCM 7639]GBR24481.1 hypothetical protein AA0473_0643 [Acetobacter orleanensis NRIC 0473]GEB82287.1 hypothetical protein AOR01nite_07640 [Acetobacter orleanensis]
MLMLPRPGSGFVFPLLYVPGVTPRRRGSHGASLTGLQAPKQALHSRARV